MAAAGAGGQGGRKDLCFGREHHAARQAVDDDAGGIVAVTDHQQHALLARQVFGLEQRREIEQRHDAAVQVHEAQQVGRHARQWIDVGHLGQLARLGERREQAHVADAKRLAHDLVRVLPARRAQPAPPAPAAAAAVRAADGEGGRSCAVRLTPQAQAVMALRIWSDV